MFTRLLICLLSFVTTSAPLFAQWEWVDNSQGSSSYETVTDVAVDSIHDAIYSVGYISGSPNFPEIGTIHGSEDGFLMKYDLLGNVQWAFAIGGTSNDRINGVAVDEASETVFVTGFIEGSAVSHGTSLIGAASGNSTPVSGTIGNQDAFIAAYNSLGGLIWYRIIGGTNVDRGMDIDVNATGVYVNGFFNNTTTLSSIVAPIPSTNQINNFVIAHDFSGNPLWNAVSGSESDDYDIPANNLTIRRTGITADASGVYVVSYFNGLTYNVYNASGSLGTSIVDPLNNSNEDYVVTSYTNSGNHNWSVLFDNDGSVVGSLDITNDCDGVYVSGALHDGGETPGGTIINSNHDNFLISKLNKGTGSELWVKEFQSTENHDDYFIGIDTDDYGNLYAVGRLRGTAASLGTDFNFTSGQGFSEVIIAHFQTDGTYRSFEVIPGANVSFGTSIATYKNEKYVIGGYHNGVLTFDAVSTSGNSDNAFVALRDLGEPISYVSAAGSNFFCQSEPTPIPTINAPNGGAFSGPPGVDFLDVNTGEINLATSAINTWHTVTYSGFPPQCKSIDTDFDIYILAGQDATFSYNTNQFCASGTDPSPTITGVSGGTFSAPADLIIDYSTGIIDLSASSLGSYYVVYTTAGFCSESDSVQIVINTAAPNPNFGYNSMNQCATGTIMPTFTVTSGGTFSAPPAIVFSDITNGIIDLSASSPGGPYSIKYVVGTGTCKDSATYDISITAPVDPAFTFASNYLCNNGSNVLPASTANNGVFSTTSALIITNASTGEIGASISPIGGPYRIYHTTSGSCPGIDSLDLYIEAAPDPSFTYSQFTYCDSIGTILPNTLLDSTGTFSGPPEIVFTNTMTGEIDIDASTVGGPYEIKYVISNTYCQDSATFSFSISPIEDPYFYYSATRFCENEPIQTPSFNGTGSGSFAGPVGLSFNSSTGVIDVSSSTVGGPYNLVYTISGSCPTSHSVDIYIDSLPNPSFTYSQSAFCDSIGTILPNTLVDSTGTFSGPPEIVFTNTMTGEIDIDASTVGGPYEIKYFVSNTYCQDSATFSFSISPIEDPYFYYSATRFCENEPIQTPSFNGTGGGSFAGPAELSFNSSTGVIDVSSSTVGGPYNLVYTTSGSCPISHSVDIYIDSLPNPSFTYSQSAFCDSIGTILPNTLLDSTGTFSGPPEIVFTNTMTGEIDIDASTVGGPYEIKYVVSNTYCQDSITFSLTIDPLENASFTYASPPKFCVNEPNPSAMISGDPGTFSALTGVTFANTTLGEIDVATSTVGGPFYVVYTTNGLTCQNSDSTQVYIEAAPDATFTYSQAAYCQGVGTILPNTLIDSTGTFSGPSEITFISTMTGEIDIDASIVGGPYEIKYLVSNTYCQDSITFSLTINGLEDASFTYPSDHFCNNEPNPFASTSGILGTFSAPTDIVFADNSTGEIDIAMSNIGGPYYVVYSTNGPTCPNSDSVQVYIEEAPDPFFAYFQTSYCEGSGFISPISPAVISGTFSELTGTVILDQSTGKVDTDLSPVGGAYTIQYLVSDIYCQDSSTFDISILGQDDIVSVDYGLGEFCISDEPQVPIIDDGMVGGTFSGPTSINFINTNTGEFDPSTSMSGGPYLIKYVTSGTCPDSLEQFITIYDAPTAYAGPDQELYFILSSSLEADIPTIGAGEWSSFPSLVDIDVLDPNSEISSLSPGENAFTWTVSNGVCPKASDELIIRVQDLFIPEALTPNDDGKNDFFELHTIDEVMCSVQIFNRWGQVIYENSDYQNEWYGQNMNGEELENDTYFYVILIDDSISYNGYVVLKK